MFRRNVGGVDRIVRVTLGTVLFAAGLVMLVHRTGYGPTVAIIGFLVLMSGILGSCGLYIPFGISTAHPRIERIKSMTCGVAGDERPDACGEPKTDKMRPTDQGPAHTGR